MQGHFSLVAEGSSLQTCKLQPDFFLGRGFMLAMRFPHAGSIVLRIRMPWQPLFSHMYHGFVTFKLLTMQSASAQTAWV